STPTGWPATSRVPVASGSRPTDPVTTAVPFAREIGSRVMRLPLSLACAPAARANARVSTTAATAKNAVRSARILSVSRMRCWGLAGIGMPPCSNVRARPLRSRQGSNLTACGRESLVRRGATPECESAWLTTIAKNVCRWQRRTLSRRGPIVDAPIDVNTLPARADDERQDALADLKHALEGIPERQRLALVLREWQGLQ